MKHKKGLQFLVFGLLSFVLMVFLGQQVSAQNNVPNINGQWTYRANLFAVDGEGCSISTRTVQQQDSAVTINQRGNTFISSGGNVYIVPARSRTPEFVKTAIGEGTITNNQIQSRIPDSNPRRVFSWTGTISSDGNTISGNVTCTTANSAGVSDRFTLTKGSQPSSSQTPSNSEAPPFPLDAGPNTIRPDFR